MIDSYKNWLYSKVTSSYKDKILFPNQFSADYTFPTSLGFVERQEKITFHTNIAKSKYVGAARIYTQREIKYNLNELGFRTWENFEEGGDVNIFLGCSHTFGYGIYQEYTWSYKLNEYLTERDGIKYKYWNIAVPGSGVDTQFRALYQLLQKFGSKIKIHNIFHFAPYYNRYEYFLTSNNNIENPEILSHHNCVDYIKPEKLISHFLSDTAISFNQIKAIEAIHSIAKEYNANYKITSFDFLTDTKELEYFVDFMYESELHDLPARDFSHISYYDNHKLFSYFVEK